MFELKDVMVARLWMLPPAAMEVAIELLWEDKLAHPHWPHVFVVPRFMTHMWRRDLGKNADVLFTVPTGVPFWGNDQFEPLIVAIVFPLAHVHSYTGPWSVKGSDMGSYYERALGAGFRCELPGERMGSGKSPSGGTCPAGTPPGGRGGGVPRNSGQLYVLDGPVPGMFDDPETGSRTLLRELLASAGRLPPVQECLVRSLLPGVTKRQLPQVGPPTKRI